MLRSRSMGPLQVGPRLHLGQATGRSLELEGEALAMIEV
jgi:hypothetical protein